MGSGRSQAQAASAERQKTQTGTLPLSEQLRKVLVCTASGREIEVHIAQEGTVRALKEQLQTKIGESPARMTLLHGHTVLQDGWKLDDAMAATLTLVMSSFPVGCFTLCGMTDHGPAGQNTTAEVTAEFQSNGGFRVTIYETEITSDYEDEEYDPYDAGAAWDHEYTGTCAVEEQELRLVVSDWKRKGQFDGLPPPDAALKGSSESVSELKLQLPLAAGGCNDGQAGLTWLTLLTKSG